MSYETLDVIDDEDLDFLDISFEDGNFENCSKTKEAYEENWPIEVLDEYEQFIPKNNNMVSNPTIISKNENLALISNKENSGLISNKKDSTLIPNKINSLPLSEMDDSGFVPKKENKVVTPKNTEKNVSRSTASNEQLKGAIQDLKVVLDEKSLNESICSRANIMCDNFNMIPEMKRGLAFIKVMQIFKRYIKK